MARITQEPGYVLHRYDWSESSLIVEVLTRRHGRVTLLAKGAKRPTSSLRSVLLPFQNLQLSFNGDHGIRTLTRAEWGGGAVMTQGEALFSGYYLNELLMCLLEREDAHEGVFDAYAQTLHLLCTQATSFSQVALRAFELLLLYELGILPPLDKQGENQVALESNKTYTLKAPNGLGPAQNADKQGLSTEQWHNIQRALGNRDKFSATLRACAEVTQELKPQLRALLHHHSGRYVWRTRQIMLDLQTL